METQTMMYIGGSGTGPFAGSFSTDMLLQFDDTIPFFIFSVRKKSKVSKVFSELLALELNISCVAFDNILKTSEQFLSIVCHSADTSIS